MIINYTKGGIRKMIKYKNKRTTLTIDLPEECGHAGYYIDCSYSFDKNEMQYLVTMELRRNDIEEYAQPIDNQYLKCDKKTIDYSIRHIVEDSALSGFFEEYIQKYEYLCDCFDKGNDFFENERLGKKSCPVKEYEIVRIAYSCTNCGTYVEEATKYCPHCNTELDWNSIKKEI